MLDRKQPHQPGKHHPNRTHEIRKNQCQSHLPQMPQRPPPTRLYHLPTLLPPPKRQPNLPKPSLAPKKSVRTALELSQKIHSRSESIGANFKIFGIRVLNSQSMYKVKKNSSPEGVTFNSIGCNPMKNSTPTTHVVSTSVQIIKMRVICVLHTNEMNIITVN